MGQIAKRVEDKRLLKLIRAFLNAGVMENGLVSPSVEGTPQGGPLSPLLSNLVLDELDRELERRGHRFVRYADDCNLYVRSERAGQRVMESVTQFITQKLKLKVNEAKSAVARPQERKFLGFSFSAGPEVKRVIAPKALDRFKRRVREITRRAKGVSMKTTIEELAPYMRGWRSYFGFCETPEVLLSLTRWVRLRLRAAMWRQWKTPRRRRERCWNWGCVRGWQATRLAADSVPGISQRPRPFLSGFPMPTSNRSVFLRWSTSNGVTSRTAVYGPVRTVVWQGSAGNRRPYADLTRYPSIGNPDKPIRHCSAFAKRTIYTERGLGPKKGNPGFGETDMKHSTDRILTTHAGRLDGPPEYRDMMMGMMSGKSVDLEAVGPKVHTAIVDVLRKQADAGIDIVSDGELGKIGFGGIGYYGRRLSGLSTRKLKPGEPAFMTLQTGERLEFADFYKELPFMAATAGACDLLRPDHLYGSGGSQEGSGILSQRRWRNRARTGRNFHVRSGAGLAGAFFPERILPQRRGVHFRSGRGHEARVQGHRGCRFHSSNRRSGSARYL